MRTREHAPNKILTCLSVPGDDIAMYFAWQGFYTRALLVPAILGIIVETFSSMVSQMLYERRFGPYYCEPVIAGLDENNKPFLSGMDLLGAQARTRYPKSVTRSEAPEPPGV